MREADAAKRNTALESVCLWEARDWNVHFGAG